MKLTALSAAPRAVEWINTTKQAHLLHLFDQVINLVNQDARVLSISSPTIGNSPFSLVVSAGDYQEAVSLQSPVTAHEEHLHIGDLSIDCRQFDLWDPRPAWQPLTKAQIQILQHQTSAALRTVVDELNFPGVLALPAERIHPGSAYSQAAEGAIALLQSGFQQADQQPVLQGAAALAGLGVGLTPAGDDFLVGMLHGLWARAADRAEMLGSLIAQAAMPRTGTLSAEWLLAAGRGEAVQAWHDLLQAVQAGEEASIPASLEEILHTGHTSGADALTGFTFILNQEQVL